MVWAKRRKQEEHEVWDEHCGVLFLPVASTTGMSASVPSPRKAVFVSSSAQLTWLRSGKQWGEKHGDVSVCVCGGGSFSSISPPHHS